MIIYPSEYSSDYFEENKFNEEDLIKLIPFGVSLNLDPSRPIIIFKDEKGHHSLPVVVNPLEEGITLGQSSPSAMAVTPHKFTQALLESLNIKISRCVFVEVKGHSQYVRVFFEGHPSHGSIKVRADEAMSLCLHLKVPIYATIKMMEKSRVMNAELEGLVQGVAKKTGILNRNSEYLM